MVSTKTTLCRAYLNYCYCSNRQIARVEEEEEEETNGTVCRRRTIRVIHPTMSTCVMFIMRKPLVVLKTCRRCSQLTRAPMEHVVMAERQTARATEENLVGTGTARISRDYLFTYWKKTAHARRCSRRSERLPRTHRNGFDID